MKKLTDYFKKEDTKVDFRRAVPLLQGLHVLYCRKIGFLLKDSGHTLKTMSDPIDVIKVEAGQSNNNAASNVAKRNKAPNSNPRYQQGN